MKSNSLTEKNNPIPISLGKHDVLDKQVYRLFVLQLKGKITLARVHAARSVNRHLIRLYWDIGKGIVEKQPIHGWGQSVVEDLSRDLPKALPSLRCFSAANLWAMRRFHVEYTDASFLQQLVEELPWGHHLLLLEKVKAPEDNPSIGMILCAQKDELEVEFSLKTKTNPIGVAAYHLTPKLPKEFKGKLPTEKQLLSVVRESFQRDSQ